MSRKLLYASPWRVPRVQGDRRVGVRVEMVEYGPALSTYERQVVAHEDWSWRPPVERRQRADAERLLAFMRPDGGPLRVTVPKREREAYRLYYELGLSSREAARVMRVSRSALRVYLRRLRERAG
jgi:DNA-directed RNA polymerase specialized sigma24 family protein